MDARILDAARDLFLARGYEGTSCEGVVALARAGKASLYVRHPDKEALFAAVIEREVARSLLATHGVPMGLPLQDRLVAVGLDLIEHALRPEPVALMRLIIAEAGRLPGLASKADALGREGGVGRVAVVVAGPDAAPAAVERARPTAAAFIDLAFVPHQMRALLGEGLDALRADAARVVGAKVRMMSAAGLLDGWR